MAIGELGAAQAKQPRGSGHIAAAAHQGFVQQLGFELTQMQRAFVIHAEALQPK